MASYTHTTDVAKPKSGYLADKHTQNPHSRQPVIPDLRFEHSYLRSIRPYIQIERSTVPSIHPVDPVHEDPEYETIHMPSGEKKTDGNDKTSMSPTSEIIHVQWGTIIWITVRDQVISPLVQGALWHLLFTSYISPFSAQLGSKVGTFAHQHLPTKEGSAVGWLRGWVKNLGLSRSDSYQTQRTRV